MTGWGVGVWIPGQAGDDDFGAGDEGSGGRGVASFGLGFQDAKGFLGRHKCRPYNRCLVTAWYLWTARNQMPGR